MKTTYPAPGILDGVTDAAEARKAIGAAQGDTDYTPRIYYDSSNDRLNIERVVDANNRRIIQCDSSGVYVHDKVSGSWKTVPQAISVGGTGATDANNARTNLGLNPVAISITAASNVTLNHNESFKIGKVGFLMAQVTIAADNVSKLGTIASGSRPNKDFYGDMFHDADKTIVAIAISSNGAIVCGSGYTKGKPYRIVMPYWIA